ncbi:MAG: beta-lactamase family protein [Anaerolineae bacterium]|nr:beta-lactamase family protein [Anaerolineae bacterium]
MQWVTGLLFGFPRVSGLTYAPGYLPAFGILSSAEDLTHYMIAMLNGGVYQDTRILSEEGVAEMLAPSASESPYTDYGLGWFVTSDSFYHGGELTDYQARVKVLPEDKLGVAFLLNTSSSTASTLFGVGYRLRIETGIINILYGASPTDQPGQSFLDLNSHSMALTHFLMLGLPVLAVLLVVLSAFRLRTMSRRLEKSRFSFWSNVVFFALVNLLLPLYLLFVLPKQSVSWGYMLHYIPDVAWFALVFSVLLLVVGLCKGAIIAVFLKDRRYPEY